MKTERTGRAAPLPVVLTSWTAKRAGAAITIEGVDAHMNPHKLVGVAGIVRHAGAAAIVTDRDGRQFELA